jgi:hypothetical protein
LQDKAAKEIDGTIKTNKNEANKATIERKQNLEK